MHGINGHDKGNAFMKPMVPEIRQISMTVDNALEYAKRYKDEFDIRPWHFLHFDETNMTGMSVHLSLSF